MKKMFRIKKSPEIEKVMRARQVVSNRYLKVFKNKNHDQTHFRFALSVPKKYGNAVERNIMKRRLRMIVSQCDIVEPIDFFIVVYPSAKQLSFQALKGSVEALLKKAKII